MSDAHDQPAHPLAPPTEAPPTANCAGCGSLFVLDGPSALCPRCRSVLPGVHIDAPGADEPFIVRDRVCINCKYDLSGLLSDRACPECGTPIRRSLQGNLLRFAAPEYVRKLLRGATIAEVAGALVALQFIVMLAILPFVTGRLEGALTIGAEIFSLAIAACSAVGWWALSAPDPDPLGDDRAIGARRLLRVSLIAELAIGTATLLVYLAFVDFATGEMMIAENVHDALMLVGMMTWLARFVISMIYLRTIALRIPDVKLYTSAGRLIWMGPLLTVVSCGVGIVVPYIAYMMMMERIRRRFSATLRQIEEGRPAC